MSRLQLALNVADVDRAVEFYSILFATAPTKRRPGYANFVVADPPLKLVLIENQQRTGTLNHLGVERETAEQVHEEHARLTAAGLTLEVEDGIDCCYAVQDKHWATGPDGQRWENYVVLEDTRSDPEGASARPDGSEAVAAQGCCASRDPVGRPLPVVPSCC